MLKTGYRGSRWESLLLNPGAPPEGSAFQSYQSLVAIGSGGVAGVGFGKSRQKFGFLPEAHNDFIFAMIGEEWGFLGTVAVILAFVALIVVGFRVARRAKDLFSELLAVGVTSRCWRCRRSSISAWDWGSSRRRGSRCRSSPSAAPT